MKSNIMKMVTMCLCLMVVGFASEGKKIINNKNVQQDQFVIDEKDHVIQKKMKEIRKQHLEDMFNSASPDDLKANPTPTGNERDASCANDDSSSDAYGDTCSSWYDAYESEGSYGCSGGYDTDTFSAAEQCCACGGGDCVNDDSASDAYGDTCSSWYDAYESPGSYGCSGGYDSGDFNAAEDCCVCQSDDDGGSDPTCAETDCGYWLNYGYDCDALGGWGYDCSTCDAEGACPVVEEDCAPGCPDGWPGDGYCDSACNNADCNYDDGDCAASCEDQGLWDCGDGQCVYDSWVCDGYADCSNSGDEADCGPPACSETSCGYWLNYGYTCNELLGYGYDCSSCDDEGLCYEPTCEETGGVTDCADDDCCPASYVGDGYADGTDQPYGCDLTCYDCDGGDIATDCAGDCGGSAQADDCGVCNGDNSSCTDDCGVVNGDNSSCADCAGTPNGDASVDECGVCDGDGTSCLDCAGVPNGDAEFDYCGVCNGDNSTCGGECGVGFIALEENSCCTGGTYNGCCGAYGWTQPSSCSGGDESIQPSYGYCGSGGCYVFCQDPCVEDPAFNDCNGDHMGDAELDDCGVCGGDNSSCTDECGVVNGDNSSCTDECGVLNGDNSSCADCAGVPNGDSIVDCSGTCVAGWLMGYLGDGWCDGSDAAWGIDLSCYDCDNGDCSEACGCEDASSCNDECGVPNGDNSSCADCLGVPNGDAETDYCGICDGDNVANDCGGGDGDGCVDGYILDCSGWYYECSFADGYQGDGWCDDGTWGIDLDCPAFDCDDGDCDSELSEDGSECVQPEPTTCIESSCGNFVHPDGWEYGHGYTCEEIELYSDGAHDCTLCEEEGWCDLIADPCADDFCPEGEYFDGHSCYDCSYCVNTYDDSSCSVDSGNDCCGACGGSASGGCGDNGDGDGDGDGGDCVNDDSTSDSYGDTCSSWYDANESPGSYGCSGGYDTDDFNAAEQCCACGDSGRNADADRDKHHKYDGNLKAYKGKILKLALYGPADKEFIYPANGSRDDCGGSGPDVGCDGVCFSGLVEDECGDCDGSGLNADGCCYDLAPDCEGTCGGEGFEDCQGTCTTYTNWIGDGYCDGTDMAYGLDFSCFDCDGGDCMDVCGCEDADSCNDCCGVPNGGNASCGGTGDINGGGLDITDVVLLVGHILQTDDLDDCQVNDGDMNGDGTVNVMDVIAQVEGIIAGYVYGCTDTDATNHDPDATHDDGSCEYSCSYLFPDTVDDCSGDGDCCPSSWIGDGFADCEEQAYGCDLTCYEDDGGDCNIESSEECSDCEYDFTAFGSECCDTAWGEYGIDCATLEANYSWDCSGCSCPGDNGGGTGGDLTCADTSCGYWLNYGYTCDDMLGYGYDCSVCDAEGACGGGDDGGSESCADTDCGYYLNYGYTCDELLGYGYDCSACDAEGACGGGDDGGSESCADSDCGYWLNYGYTCDDMLGYGYDCSACDAEGACGGGDDGGECVNDDSTSDAYGDTCSSWYDAYESPGSYGCSGGYDTADFSAADQCCVCQGARSDDAKTPSMIHDIMGSGAKKLLISSDKNPADVFKPDHKGLNRKSTSGLESSLQKANSVQVIQTAEGLSYEADGFVGFELTLSHGADFEIDMASEAFIGMYNTIGNTTKLVVVNNETSELFTSSGDFGIVDVIAGTAGGTAVSVDVVIAPKAFGLSDAYPNPFNPTTTVDLNVAQEGFVSVKVYNVMGQMMATLHEGNLSASTHSFTWDAADMASGMYFIQAETAGNMSIQKIMYMK